MKTMGPKGNLKASADNLLGRNRFPFKELGAAGRRNFFIETITF
jgi:hypothetical protein